MDSLRNTFITDTKISQRDHDTTDCARKDKQLHLTHAFAVPQ